MPSLAPLLRLPLIPEIDQPDLVMFGFHGTRADFARRILDEQRMIPSTHEYEWLGHGIYFWEDDPARAYDWGLRRFPGEKIAVVQARIRRGTCLNELNSTHGDVVRAAERLLAEREAREGRDMPENRGLRSDRDCAVFNFLYENIDSPIDTVRASFPEGRVRYDDSRLRERNHIQICVRNPVCILKLSIYNGVGIDHGAED